MASNVHELRPKPPETEKITINLGYVDLGHVDLMVQDGFYSNRTDFIRTAIRNQLERHADVVKQSREPSMHSSEPPPMHCSSSNLINAQTSSLTPDTAWNKRNLLSSCKFARSSTETRPNLDAKKAPNGGSEP